MRTSTLLQVEGIVGDELNYDETCLYNRDAVRPAFLILYR